MAFLATSIFHLAHWHNSVTVRNYIMTALTDEAMEKREKNNQNNFQLFIAPEYQTK